MQRTSVKRRLGIPPGQFDDDSLAIRRPKHYHGFSGTHYNNWKRNSPPPPQPPPSPPPTYDKNLVALTQLNRKLDELSSDDLECLKAMIRVKETRKNTRRSEPSQDAPGHITVDHDIRGYTTSSLGLCKYPSDLHDPRKLAENRYTERGTPLIVTHDELMNTDYLLLLRKHFDALPVMDLRVLVEDRVFSINNAPSLEVILALADESLAYVKFHRVHNLPVNPEDPYMSTIGYIKYAVFNRLNLTELSCILDGGPTREREYQILRQLANKPTIHTRSTPSPFEIHRRPPTSFKSPIQQAMAVIAACSRSICAIKRRATHDRGPFFVRDFDDLSIVDSYRCGMISELIIEALREHQCQDGICRIKLRKLLQPYRVSIFFCPFNNGRRQRESAYRRDTRERRRGPSMELSLPKLAYSTSDDVNETQSTTDTSREKSQRRERRRTKHAHHRSRHRHRSTHHSVSSEISQNSDTRAITAVTSTTAHGITEDHKNHKKDTESQEKQEKGTHHIQEVKQKITEPEEKNEPDIDSDTSDDLDSDGECINGENDVEIHLSQTETFTVDEVGTQDDPQSSDTGEIDDEDTPSQDTESMWTTTSISQMTIPTQIHIHREIAGGDSDIEIGEYVEHQIQTNELIDHNESPFDDAIMECDLSYSEMDSD